jgi:transcriptional regulator with XRE-family HTH domain
MPTKQNREVDRFTSDVVRTALLKRHLTLTNLAQRLGMSRDTLSARLSGGNLSSRDQARVEQIFEFKEPIWSTSRDLVLRELCFGKTGIDPAQLSLPELKDFARKLGMTSRFQDNRAAVLGAILDYAAAHPQSLKI